jgi:hypothetical protein
MKVWPIFILLICPGFTLLAQTDTTKKVPPPVTPPPAVPVQIPVNQVIQQNYIQYQNSSESTNDLLLQQIDQVKKQEQKKAAGAVLKPSVIIVDPSEKNNPPSKTVAPPGQTNQQAIHPSSDELPGGHRILTGPTPYDSRVEVRSLDPTVPWVKKLLVNARSVAIVVDRSLLIKVSSGYYQIDGSRTLGALYQLCPGEAFSNEPVLGTGTAMVTGTRQMMTAGHVFTGPLQNYAVVFGFEIYDKAGGYKRLISTDSVFFPQKILHTSAELDISIFSVDRDLPSPPLIWSMVTNPPINEPVYMIGHPYGLPKKVAANASVQTNNDPAYLYTSLDAFEGNSGSPVFDLQTNQVIGILVGGETDFNWNGTCNISNVCTIPFCQGEKVVRITVIRDLLH